MSYDPKAITTDDRTFAMNVMWVGLAGSWLLLTGYAFGFFELVDSLAGGFTSGTLIALVFVGRHDEYFQRLVTVSASWACAMVGLWMFVNVAPITDDFRIDSSLGLTLVATVFHTVFAAARLRGF